MVKIVTFFLIGMVVLALFGRLRWPGALKRLAKRRDSALPKPRTCPKCGRVNLRGGTCPSCPEDGNG